MDVPYVWNPLVELALATSFWNAGLTIKGYGLSSFFPKLNGEDT